MLWEILSFVAIGLKVMCFIALRVEDEPLSEMSVELEGTAECLHCSASLVWTMFECDPIAESKSNKHKI